VSVKVAVGSSSSARGSQALLPGGELLPLLQGCLCLHGARPDGQTALDIAVTASVVVTGHSCRQGQSNTDLGLPKDKQREQNGLFRAVESSLMVMALGV
jgi:hypothetical protein